MKYVKCPKCESIKDVVYYLMGCGEGYKKECKCMKCQHEWIEETETEETREFNA